MTEHDTPNSDGALVRLLVYTSAYAGNDLDADLASIKAQAHRNNPRRGITGVLLFERGRFIQVLEGDDAAITALVDRIGADPRTRELEILIDTHLRFRSFQQWAMWVGKVREGTGEKIHELRAFRDAYLKAFKPDGEGFVALVRRVLEDNITPL